MSGKRSVGEAARLPGHQRDTDRLADAGILPAIGSFGDSDDNALAETINGHFRSELVHRKGPWRNMQVLEMATPEWVD